MGRVFTTLQRLLDGCLDALTSCFARWTKPLGTSLPLATLTDLGKNKFQLIAENALLRQQLSILKRQVKRPPITKTDRMLLVLLSRLVRSWQQALLIVQPGTLLRWHRELFHQFWKHKSKAHAHNRIAVTQDHPCRRHSFADRCMDGPTAPESDFLWASTQVSDP